MLTDLQKKKLRRLFNVLDSDHNGQLERGDYSAVVSNLSRIHGWETGSKEQSTAENLYMTIWGNLKALADENNDGQVSEAEFLQFHDQMLSSPEMYDQITGGTVELLFEAFDRNKDGSLSGADFRDFFKAYGLGEQEADEAFSKMSRNGAVSRAEAEERVREFYFSDEPGAAGNWLFGRHD